MLFLKHNIRHASLQLCNVQCSVNSMGKQKPLRVRVKQWILQRRNRASCFDSCRASVTVETSLAFPIFLCAVACIIGLSQMVLIEAEVHHAISQTAKVYAKQQAVQRVPELLKEVDENVKEDEEGGKRQQKENQQGNSKLFNGKGGSVGSIFFSVYDGGSLCRTMIEGGQKGIKVYASVSGEEVYLKAEYILKMPVPFFSGIRFQRNTATKRRIFSGYVKHWGEYEDSEDNQIVYVAENGVVYHKSATCSHICLKITGNAAIKEILQSSKYNACEKCIHNNGNNSGNLSALFVTAYGDCYHSTLGCSGLKRTIRAVRLKEVKGLRPCSRCASGK